MEWSTDWALLFENSAVDDGEVMEVQEWRIDGRVYDGVRETSGRRFSKAGDKLPR